MLLALRFQRQRVVKFNNFSAASFASAILAQTRAPKKQVVKAALHNNSIRQLDLMSARRSSGKMQNVSNMTARKSRPITLQSLKNSPDKPRSQRRHRPTISANVSTQLEWPQQIIDRNPKCLLLFAHQRGKTLLHQRIPEFFVVPRQHRKIIQMRNNRRLKIPLQLWQQPRPNPRAQPRFIQI